MRRADISVRPHPADAVLGKGRASSVGGQLEFRNVPNRPPHRGLYIGTSAEWRPIRRCCPGRVLKGADLHTWSGMARICMKLSGQAAEKGKVGGFQPFRREKVKGRSRDASTPPLRFGRSRDNSKTLEGTILGLPPLQADGLQGCGSRFSGCEFRGRNPGGWGATDIILLSFPFPGIPASGHRCGWELWRSRLSSPERWMERGSWLDCGNRFFKNSQPLRGEPAAA